MKLIVYVMRCYQINKLEKIKAVLFSAVFNYLNKSAFSGRNAIFSFLPDNAPL